jgi:hypothetical protein
MEKTLVSERALRLLRNISNDASTNGLYDWPDQTGWLPQANQVACWNGYGFSDQGTETVSTRTVKKLNRDCILYYEVKVVYYCFW